MSGFDPALPFVLLDDARAGGSARLFTGLASEIVATTAADVAPAFDLLRGDGTYAGFIGFEAGYALEPRLAALARPGGDGLPLLWFGCFTRSEAVDAAALLDDAATGGAVRIGPVVPTIDAATYGARVADILALIAAGEIYQANLTFAADVAVGGHPIALYRRLRAAAAAPYCALIHTGRAWIVSLSPELFFSLADGQLTARPMKGTAARGPTRADDDAAAAALAADPKNRAENLMIVDLLRNDLARVAVPGSVAVPALFAVERYPTLLQMTSTITATTTATPVDVLTAIFPCGSITGAPKIRAMQAIAAVEAAPRGLYTGAIGTLSGGQAAFNVAIRTLVMAEPGRARIGLGAGIVADSDPAEEWRECLSKAAFLTRGPPPDLIETLRSDHGRIALLERHLARLAATAAFLDYSLDLSAIRRAVLAATAEADVTAAAEAGADADAGAGARLRLLVSPRGAVAVERSPLPVVPVDPVIVLAALPVAPGDWRLRHKTTDRRFYDTARSASGAFEVVFVAPDGGLTEGSFTNIFVPRDGVLVTPPLAAGLLPGILRAELLATGRAVEGRLIAADLGDGCLVGNAVRGLIGVRVRSTDTRGVSVRTDRLG